MTQENKNLLLRDLCARLPYGVIVKDRNGIHKLTVGNTEFTDLFYSNKCNIKPYLRPMSSMTEDEKKELKEVLSPQGTANYECNGISIPMSHFGEFVPYEYMGRVIDWLNAHHFDYRGLIEKGLAIAVTEDNSPYKE